MTDLENQSSAVVQAVRKAAEEERELELLRERKAVLASEERILELRVRALEHAERAGLQLVRHGEPFAVDAGGGEIVEMVLTAVHRRLHGPTTIEATDRRTFEEQTRQWPIPDRARNMHIHVQAGGNMARQLDRMRERVAEVAAEEDWRLYQGERKQDS